MKIRFNFKDDKLQHEREFTFDNRKDAIQLKKYLSEMYEDGELSFRIDPKNLSINSLYSTE